MKAQKVNVTATAVGMEGSAPAAPQSPDMVNRPNHYAPNGRDSFMHLKDQMGKDAFDGFLQGNAIKYVQRYKFKGKPVEDLCKAAFYLFHLALETTDGSPEAVYKVVDRMATTLSHAAEHYEPEDILGTGTNKPKDDPRQMDLFAGQATVDDTSTTVRKCPRCKASALGCEFFDGGACKGVVYLTNPPQYDPCVFCYGEVRQ